MKLRFGAQRIANNHENEIADRDDQSHAETDGRLPSMRGDAKWHADESKNQATKCKRKALANLSAAAAVLPFVVALQLVEQWLDRHGRAILGLLFAFVKSLDT